MNDLIFMISKRKYIEGEIFRNEILSLYFQYLNILLNKINSNLLTKIYFN